MMKKRNALIKAERPFGAIRVKNEQQRRGAMTFWRKSGMRERGKLPDPARRWCAAATRCRLDVLNKSGSRTPIEISPRGA